MIVNKELFKKRLRKAASDKALSMRELAIRTGLTYSTVLDAANGKAVFRFLTMQKVARILEISSGYLAGQHDDPKGPHADPHNYCRDCGVQINERAILCEKCKKEHENEKAREKYRAEKGEADPKDQPASMSPNMLAISELEAEARRHGGCHYGRWTAYKREKEAKGEKK